MTTFRWVGGFLVVCIFILSACGPKPDKTPPVIKILTGPSEVVNGSTTGFTLEVSDDVSSQDQIEVGTMFLPGEDWKWSHDMAQEFHDLSDGQHVLAVQARDSAGNESNAVFMKFTVLKLPCGLGGSS